MQVPGEHLAEADTGELTLKSFQNFYDHFKKPKHTENIFIKRIFDMRKKCSKFPNKVCFTALTYYRRFFFKNCLLEFDEEIISAVCMFLASKIEERTQTNLELFFRTNFPNFT
jgi:hypothetical protein